MTTHRVWAHTAAVGIPAALGVAWMLLCFHLYTPAYGVALFVGGPVAIGVASALACAALRIQRNVLPLTFASVVLCGLMLIASHLEGLICLVMALPLAVPLALLGAWMTNLIIRKAQRSQVFAPAILVPFLFVNFPVGELRSVESHVEVAASPEVVWQNVIEFSDLPEPKEFIFKTGLAYPKRARITGTGVGAVRNCEFSTGDFVEPVTVWDQPRLLRFSVTSMPEPMTELTPYGSLHPPHLNGYFISRRGEFLLTRLPNGHTLLSGTTWYELRMGPAPYWNFWSDYIIHRIHLRVLEHIRNLSEGAA